LNPKTLNPDLRGAIALRVDGDEDWLNILPFVLLV
jgi:hypothetical protein